jgi:hypothetical protein
MRGLLALAPTTLVRLERQLEALPTILGSAGPEALRRKPAAGGWSALENLAHLGRHHEVLLERLTRIRAEDAPPLPAYRAESDPEWPRWRALSTDQVLDRLRALRAELVALVRALDASDLARTGRHSSLGPLTVAEWLEFFLVHEAHHLYVAMKRARGGD